MVLEGYRLTYSTEGEEEDGLAKFNLFDEKDGSRFVSLTIRNCVLAVKGLAIYGPDYSLEQEGEGFDPNNFPSVRFESVGQAKGFACTLCLHGAFDEVLLSDVTVARLALGTADAAEADRDTFRSADLILLDCRFKRLTTMETEDDFLSDDLLAAFACNTLHWGGGQVDVVEWTMGPCEPGGYYTDKDGKRQVLTPPKLGLVLVTDDAWQRYLADLCRKASVRYCGPNIRDLSTVIVEDD